MSAARVRSMPGRGTARISASAPTAAKLKESRDHGATRAPLVRGLGWTLSAGAADSLWGAESGGVHGELSGTADAYQIKVPSATLTATTDRSGDRGFRNEDEDKVLKLSSLLIVRAERHSAYAMESAANRSDVSLVLWVEVEAEMHLPQLLVSRNRHVQIGFLSSAVGAGDVLDYDLGAQPGSAGPPWVRDLKVRLSVDL
jgi:hypothetical protein